MQPAAWLAFAVATLTIPAANAEEVLGQNIVSAPNVATLFWVDSGSQETSGERDLQTHLRLGGGFLVGGGGSPDDIPRVGYDHVFFERMTLGLDLGIGQSTVTATGSLPPSTTTIPAFAVGVSPRIGLLIPLAEGLALWPRAGLSFLYSSATNTRRSNDGFSTSVNTVSEFRIPLNLQLLLVVTPLPHMAFCAGLAFDPTLLSVTTSSHGNGDTDPTPKTATATGWHGSLAAGLLVHW